AQRLVDSDRDNVTSQQELSLAHMDLGDVLWTQRKMEEALKAYRDSVATLEQLPPDPSHMRTQLLIATALWRISQLSPDPSEDGARAAAILERLQDDGRLMPWGKRQLDTIKTALAKAELRATIQRESAAAQAAFGRQEYPAAVELQISLMKATEKLETEERGGPGIDTVNALGDLSWYALFARRFDDALAATEHALALAPALAPAATWIATNRAHALMFLERAEEAQALYMAHKGTRVGGNRKLWEEAIANDFAELERADLPHAQMAEIRKLLNSTEEAV